MMPAIWNRLNCVRSFTTVVHETEPTDGVTRRVVGHAQPSLEDDGQTLRVAENGWLYLPGSTRTLATSNVYCWRVEAGQLALSYDRAQIGRSARLVVFEPASAVGLQSASPHCCGADRYYAHVTLTGEDIELRWHVVGTAKNYIMITRYRPHTLQGQATVSSVSATDQ
ncbi:hypothetical protein HKX42_02495 [Salinisphaera sp. USBA-960]|nr:hypothetical protein [Salifodinibacter halophilus]NNC25745.1 hypothetical protein [Salifodinibacter halophilus]